MSACDRRKELLEAVHWVANDMDTQCNGLVFLPAYYWTRYRASGYVVFDSGRCYVKLDHEGWWRSEYSPRCVAGIRETSTPAGCSCAGLPADAMYLTGANCNGDWLPPTEPGGEDEYGPRIPYAWPAPVWYYYDDMPDRSGVPQPVWDAATGTWSVREVNEPYEEFMEEYTISQDHGPKNCQTVLRDLMHIEIEYVPFGEICSPTHVPETKKFILDLEPGELSFRSQTGMWYTPMILIQRFWRNSPYTRGEVVTLTRWTYLYYDGGSWRTKWYEEGSLPVDCVCSGYTEYTKLKEFTIPEFNNLVIQKSVLRELRRNEGYTYYTENAYSETYPWQWSSGFRTWDYYGITPLTTDVWSVPQRTGCEVCCPDIRFVYKPASAEELDKIGSSHEASAIWWHGLKALGMQNYAVHYGNIDGVREAASLTLTASKGTENVLIKFIVPSADPSACGPEIPPRWYALCPDTIKVRGTGGCWDARTGGPCDQGGQETPSGSRAFTSDVTINGVTITKEAQWGGDEENFASVSASELGLDMVVINECENTYGTYRIFAQGSSSVSWSASWRLGKLPAALSYLRNVRRGSAADVIE